MPRYTSILYVPTVSLSSGVAASQVLSATESIGVAEGGVLDSVQMYNLADITRGMTLYILGSSGGVGTESANFSPADSVAETFLAQIQFNSGKYVDLVNSLFQTKTDASTGQQGLGEYMANVSSSSNALLYAAIVANTSTNTKFTTGSLKFRFNFRHD
jgi:hypothetical protein